MTKGGSYFFILPFTNSSQKISTQGLTVLIIRVIVHIEQKKARIKRRGREFWSVFYADRSTLTDGGVCYDKGKRLL